MLQEHLICRLMVVVAAVAQATAIAATNPAAVGGPLYDQAGGIASTHVIACIRENIAPVRQNDGRWTLRAKGHFPAANNAAEQVDAAADALAQWNVTDIQPVIAFEPANAKLSSSRRLMRYYRIEVPAGTDTAAMAAYLRSFENVCESVHVDGVGGIAETIPNDQHFALFQYALKNTGQQINGVFGTPGADINATFAWDITTGTDNLILAVCDSGVNEHVDLADRLLVGYNTVFDNTYTEDGCQSHGTHVTGSAAANADNGIGIAGVNWNIRILPVRVLNGCNGVESDLAEGIIYAADNGADVINMSLQYYTGTDVLHDAVQYAHAAGVILVAAAGNQQSVVAYPAKWTETIAVAATTNLDEVWVDSNPGPQVDFAAPGKDVFSLSSIGSYSLKSGTSMASPHVAGLVSLMRSVAPTLDLTDIRLILRDTVVDIDPPGADVDTGHGRIDAFEALLALLADLPGDVNADEFVDLSDHALLLNCLTGPDEVSVPGNCTPDAFDRADLDSDGDVDASDVSTFMRTWVQ